MCECIYKLADFSQGQPKGSFSIATMPRCRRSHYSFPWITPLTLDPSRIMLTVKQGGIKYQFLSFWYDSTWDWTSVFWMIGKHSTHYANGQFCVCIYTYIIKWEEILKSWKSIRIFLLNLFTIKLFFKFWIYKIMLCIQCFKS